jgi:hypothetical protein
MDQTLKQAGELLLGAIPTAVLLLLLYAIYSALVHKPLKRALEERRERTEGALLKARADIAAAEAKARITNRTCGRRAWQSLRLRKRAASGPSKLALRRSWKRVVAPNNRFAKRVPPSTRTWLQRARGCKGRPRDSRQRSSAQFCGLQVWSPQ